MISTGFLELVIRSVVSLGIVLALIGVAYLVARRRASGGLPTTSLRRSPQFGRGASKRAPATLETVARVGLSRGSVAIAVRFADQVVLLGVAEGSPISVLQEIPADRWDELADTADTVATPVTAPRPAHDVNGLDAVDRPGFIEALREATTRRV